MNDGDSDRGLLSFSLGPVQSFIEAARTVRDLWTGSYILSWLTASAMKKVIEHGDVRIISPSIDENKLIDAVFGRLQHSDRREAMIPCLPNRFIADIPARDIEELPGQVRDACRTAWEQICEGVHDTIARQLSTLDEDWDLLWKEQIKDYFEIRCFAARRDELTPTVANDLGIEVGESGWAAFETLGGILDAHRSIRHVPNYVPTAHAEFRYPAKCSLLGSYEQMGPALTGESAKFWKWVGEGKVHYGGSRLGSNDRYCAISIVRRFAWPAYFSRPERVGLNPRESRFADTATVAAKLWLRCEPEIDPKAIWNDHDYWSGQWLYWTKPDQDPEDPCDPEGLFSRIVEKRKANGWPPRYYAVLMMDGDDMGKLFRGEGGIGPEFGQGEERHQNISRRLANFALMRVRTIVAPPGQSDSGQATYGAELIYCGGDDVVVLGPTETIIACADRIRRDFTSKEVLEGRHMSAGIAVVHHKEDLRFALRAARHAEERAKSLGKDAVGLAVCRRSGEHQMVVMGWAEAEGFQRLVELFRGDGEARGVSDRWVYKLRAELPALGLHDENKPEEPDDREMKFEMFGAELGRHLRRVDAPEELHGTFVATVDALWKAYREDMARRETELQHRKPSHRVRHAGELITDFVALCQSAAFMARGGGDE